MAVRFELTGVQQLKKLGMLKKKKKRITEEN